MRSASSCLRRSSTGYKPSAPPLPAKGWYFTRWNRPRLPCTRSHPDRFMEPMINEPPFEQSLGFKAFLAVPVPGLDMAMVLAVYAVEGSVRDGMSDASRAVSASIERSLDGACTSLIAAVSSQAAEVMSNFTPQGHRQSRRDEDGTRSEAPCADGQGR